MRKSLQSFVVALVLGCGGAELPARTTSQPIVNGQLDADAYPSVGALVVPSSASGPGAPPGLVSQCTGTLVAPDVFLSAAHCVRRLLSLPHGAFGVTFDAVYVPAVTPLRSGTPWVHPQFDFDTGLLDVGIIVLDEPVQGIEPARIAAHDTLTKMDPQALLDARVVAVGYGSTNDTRFGPGNGRGTRRVAVEQSFGTYGTALGAPFDNWLVLGGAYADGYGVGSFGDSGGPRFLDGEVVSVCSRGDFDPEFGVELTQRIDLKDAHKFIKAFIDGESADVRQDL